MCLTTHYNGSTVGGVHNRQITMPFHFIRYYLWVSPEAKVVCCVPLIPSRARLFSWLLLQETFVITTVRKHFPLLSVKMKAGGDLTNKISCQVESNLHIQPVNFMKLIMTRFTPAWHTFWGPTQITPVLCILFDYSFGRHSVLGEFIQGVYSRSMCLLC